MGKLVAAMDWTKTPLGSIGSWPQSLRTTVSLCLASNFPISLAWGPSHIQIYNDGYWPICGAKHPSSMGQDFRECWASAWPVIGAAFEQALAGETSYLENQRMFLDRNGYLEETFFTFSFSPIRDESGGVGGLFHPVTEQTGRMLSERRIRALRDLSARTSKAKAVSDVFAIAAETLSEYNLDLPFALFYVVDAEGQTAQLSAHTGLEANTAASPIIIDISAGSPGWPVLQVLRTADPIQVDEVEKSFGPLLCDPYPETPKTAFLLPIRAAGSDRANAFIIAGASARLPLDDSYRSFFDFLSSTVTAAVNNARAYQEERLRAEALAELDHAKTTFFSNISHEFRTPLSLMLGPIEDALGDQTSTLASEQRERLTIAHRNALRLLKLVNTLLEFSRIEAGRVQAAFEPVDLSALTSDLASNFRSLCERASLRLMINCPTLTEPVYIDTEMWEKIVLNLVSNAFKFTFEGEIEVSLHAIDNAVELSVRDTGTGIPAHELPHLFKRFHRIEGAQGRTYEGSGIGLALVQELAKLHGGTLNVESAQGKGSIFRLRIPFGNGHLPQDQIRSARNIPATAANATSFIEEALRSLPDVLATHTANGNELGFSEKSALSPAVNDAERPCVLLADDNADMRAYIARVLTEGGYDVRPFSDGLMALHAIRDGLRPDLVLSDIMMPRLDGFGLLRELRSNPTLENLLVIFLSARAGEEARIEGIAAGADDYLLKPFGARELRARVDGAIRLGRLRREAAIRERELEAEIIRQGGRAALHESETRRRISEEKYQLLMEHARDAILTVNSDGEVLELNRQAELLFGRSRDEIVGRLFNSFSEASDFNRFRADTAKLIESRLIRTDEDRIDTEISSARVVIDGEEIVVLIIRDITERLLLEQKLGRAQKMEAIGQLTGGVAHDFNNLLTVILSNADTLAEELEGNADLRALAEMTRTAAERGADLTQSLLAFARRQALEPQVLDVNTLVAGMEGLLRRTLGDNIQISLVQSPDTRRAIVDSAQLESAILNLSINARDAMPNGGQLTIETGNAQLDQAYADVNDEVNAGDYVLLCVSDTGTGMPPEVAARAFDPFFSTKDVGKGTGLGLSMVYGFVKQSGGHIKIYSEMGLGTSFRIYLPLAHQTQSIADVQSTRKVVDPIGTETILLVEDDDLVREHSERVVRSLGYRVLVASSGPSGMEIVKSGEHIDLLFTDVVMPGGMTGRQLAALAMEGLPNLKVLFTSGYNENVILHHGQLDPGVHLLRKPYRKRDLALKLRQLLE